MRKSAFVLSVMAIFVLTQAAEAQIGGPSTPKFFTEFKPVVGGWAEYQLKGQGDNAPSKMKISVVGKEGDAFWYETEMEGGKRGKTIAKMLVSGDPADTTHVKKMIIKEGNKPAMEIPANMMAMGAGKKQALKGKFTEMGTETITVPAGTFKTQHMQYKDGDIVTDVWVNAGISLYGLVKSVSKNDEMILIAYGKGAVSQITETPKTLEMPKLPGGLFGPKDQ